MGELDGVPCSAGGDWSIYKVQEKIRKINEFAYTPEMVSIGPFHRDKVALQAMEAHKLRYMNLLLSRSINQEAILKECIEAISCKEVEARKCYSEPVEPDRNKFVRMMVVDGLFIIELLCKSAWDVRIEKDDPVFNAWGTSTLVRDMILLENQIPMFVLEILFSITTAKQVGTSLNVLAICFFRRFICGEKNFLWNGLNKKSKHLLDLLHKPFGEFCQNNCIILDVQVKLAPCALELREAGVQFKKRSDGVNFLDVKFTDGVLEIPPIHIQDQTEPFFLNLIAFEQCCDGSAACMTSYAILMHNLISSPNDIEFLRRNGIIKSYKSNDECFSLFKKLCTVIVIGYFSYSVLCHRLTEYHKTRWHIWKATLQHDYFQTPWKVMSVVAAVVLLILTFTSTLFAILSFFIHKS